MKDELNPRETFERASDEGEIVRVELIIDCIVVIGYDGENFRDNLRNALLRVPPSMLIDVKIAMQLNHLVGTILYKKYIDFKE